MKVGFLGAGSMASALARGLAEPALAYDVQPDRAEALAEAVGGEAVSSPTELAERSDVVFLAHKPTQLAEAAEGVAGVAGAVASIVAATPVARLEETYPGIPVYRFLPSIPVEVGRGVVCYVPGTLAADGPEEELLKLLGRAGTLIELDESLVDPAMALMSCGPAFFAVAVDALAEAGAGHGLHPDQARRMVVETMAGSAAFLDANGLDAPGLRDRVATPGGVTERGLGLLAERGVPAALSDVVDLIVEASRA